MMCDLKCQLIASPRGGAVTGGQKWANDSSALCVTYLCTLVRSAETKTNCDKTKISLKVSLVPLCVKSNWCVFLNSVSERAMMSLMEPWRLE